MNYEAFIKNVQRHCHLQSRTEAVAAIRATLMTLGERITGEECGDLAAQLTEEIAFYLREGSMRVSRKLSYPEFIQRVAERASLSITEAHFRARGVMAVLTEAVSAGEMHDVRSQLPRDFAPLFASATQAHQH